MLQGVFTALATPFLQDGSLDVPSLLKLLRAQLNAGVQGVVLLGTTAETPTLSTTEKKQILDVCVPEIKKTGCQLIIGCGTNCTASTVENVRLATAYQPDAALVVTPYYNKPNPSGMVAHFKAAASVGVPLVLYHIPGRTGQKLAAPVLAALLKEIPQLIGIKESDYDMAHVTDTAVAYKNRLAYLCGNDDLFPQFLALNAAGIISAAACVLAPAFVKIYDLFKQGQTQQAFAVFAQIYPLVKACYLETNPTCIKYMLSKLGYGAPAVRLPLGETSTENKTKIDALLAQTPKEFLV
ncbi:MAG: 4-hydroxy-tetrahydrodipicolinate synthase [Elusimicrobiaceae bacterium]|nr:4-hydroxy-tetrahydrodipicolinate synthase [Elusimicrobiaceae bacterium]